jgi:energy-coupling factor transporter ATP-binding protein EcfA2
MEDISLKPDAVYQQIKSELDKVVRSINELPSEEAVNEAKNNAQNTLGEFQQDLNKQLQELQKNSEWDRFTIAFYGETGAGKSTLIETLRILLNEPSKAKQRAQFVQTREQMEASAQRIAALDADIQATHDLIRQLAQQLQATRERFAAPQQAAQQAIDAANARYQAAREQLQAQWNATKAMLDNASQAVLRLENYLAHYKKTASLWSKLKGLFTKLPERQELLKAQLSLQEAADAHATSCTQTQVAQQQLQQELAELEKQLAQTHAACEQACAQVEQEEKRTVQQLVTLQSEQQNQVQQQAQLSAQLSQHADGEIIGVGNSDTTKYTQQYNFSLQGQDFALLDVPGIEGKEASVIAQIEVAIQKAHAVFYMTNKPSAPQKGDGSTKGTLEKIKEHLGAQTEVWSIYNKKITNPRQSLKNKPVATDSELETINAPDASGLNFSMREQLGRHYRETVTLAALPAFHASTDHFLPDSQHFKRRTKTMEDFTSEDLLQSAGLSGFVDLLGGSLVVDAKARIQRSNFNKAHEALKTTLDKLQSLKSNFSALFRALSKQEVDAKSQLQSSCQSLRLRLQTGGSSLIQEFESTVRQRVYSRIDDDISNDDFKSALSSHVEQQQQKLQEKLPSVMGQEIERFKSDVQDVVDRFAEQAKELSDIYALLNKTQLHSDIDININIDSGVKIGSLLLTLGGAVLAVLGTGGWVLAIGLVGLVFSFAKSIWGFFDSDFKKAEQRKSTSQNLSKIVSKLEDSLEEGLKKTMPELQEKLQMIEKALEVPARETKALVRIFDYSSDRLTLTSKQILSQGGLQ